VSPGRRRAGLRGPWLDPSPGPPGMLTESESAGVAAAAADVPLSDLNLSGGTNRRSPAGRPAVALRLTDELGSSK
jgi:hypothetical protein